MLYIIGVIISSRFHHVWRLLHNPSCRSKLPAGPGLGSTAIAGENKSSSIAQLVPTALGDVHQWAWCVENWAVFHSSCSWNIGLWPRSLDLPPGFQGFLWGNDEARILTMIPGVRSQWGHYTVPYCTQIYSTMVVLNRFSYQQKTSCWIVGAISLHTEI